jgi:hypothetical protein
VAADCGRLKPVLKGIQPTDALEREMSARPADIARGLAVAFPGAVQGGPNRFAVTVPGAAMELQITPGPDRVIALLRLPTLTLSIRFTAGNAAAQGEMLRRFDLAMRRGGG